MKKVVLAHLDRLPLELQMIIKIASALGVRVDKEVLAEIYHKPASEVEVALRSRGVRDYLTPELGDADITGNHRYFVFASEGVCDIIYNLMLLTQRQRLHGLTAEWYERLYDLHPSRELIHSLAFHAQRSCAGQAADIARAVAANEVSQAIPPETEMARWSLLAAGRAALKQGNYTDGVKRLEECAALVDLNSLSVDPKLVDARVALAGMFSEFAEFGCLPPEGVLAITTLDPLLKLLEQANAGAQSQLGQGQGSTALLNTADIQLLLAQVYHARGWATMTQQLPGWLVVASGSSGGAHPASPATLEVIESSFKRAVELRDSAERQDLAAESLCALGVYWHARAQETESRDFPTMSKQTTAQRHESFQRSSSSFSDALERCKGASASVGQIKTSLAALQLDNAWQQASVTQAIENAIQAAHLYGLELGAFHPRTCSAFEVLARGYQKSGDQEHELSVRRQVKLTRLVHSDGTAGRLSSALPSSSPPLCILPSQPPCLTPRLLIRFC